MSNTNDEHRKTLRDDLREKLFRAVSQTMGNNDLGNDEQIEVLSEVYLSIVRLYGEFNGIDPQEFAQDLLQQLLTINNPDYSPTPPMDDVGNHRSPDFGYIPPQFSPTPPMQPRRNEGIAGGGHRGGRIVKPSEDNSWLRVFATLLTKDEVKAMVGDQGTTMLLTSMPDEYKADIKRMGETLAVRFVSSPTSRALKMVCFGDGLLASRKTELIRQRIGTGDDIKGAYYWNVIEALDELIAEG